MPAVAGVPTSPVTVAAAPGPLATRADSTVQPHRSPVTRWILIGSFVLATAVRLYTLSATGVLADRDYLSAMIARDFYFRHADVEPWRKDMAASLRQSQPVLEPPVTEYLVSLLYRVAGREDMRFARALTTIFWLLGGVILYRLARRLADSEAALIATIYYLFVPSGILLSRSFQPDALMMLTFLASLVALWTYHERPTARNLVVAGVIAGFTILHRPLVLFALLAAFAALSVVQHGVRGLIRRQTLLYGVLAMIPAGLYYGYGTFIEDFMRWKVESSFRPYLLLHREFWAGWIAECMAEIGAAVLIAALAGVGLLGRGPSAALIVGLGIGYVVFGLAFTMHIHTHTYYHAQLIPVVAIPFGMIVMVVVNRLRVACQRWYHWLPAAGALALIAFFWQGETRDPLVKPVFVLESERAARDIGRLVRHSKQVVFLSRSYGLPLLYMAEFTGAYWPRSITSWLYRTRNERALSIDERLAALGFTPEYFVITDFREYRNNHQDLIAYLARNCSPLANDPEYLIFSSCSSGSAKRD